MAEGIFNNMVEKSGKGKRYKAFSAGLSAFDGDCANPKAVKVLDEHYTIDIKGHRARSITESSAENAYLILTMTKAHKDAVLHMFEQTRNKTYTLKEFIADKKVKENVGEYDFSFDIQDPYGMPELVYIRCAEEIKDAVESLIAKLEKF
jgi:protein-tyrosine-phosphatase